MKKFLKASLAVILCFVMLIGIMPMGTFAENNQSGVTASTENLSVSGTDGFGRVLSKAAAEENEDTGYCIERFYIVSDKIAYVKYAAKEDCRIILAVYSDESEQMLGSGIKNVSKDESEVNITIDIETMPEHYILKAFMLGNNNEPLCAEQYNIESSSMFEIFDNKTVDDFNDNIVLNFDEKKNDNFAVLVDGAIEIQYDSINNILKSYDEETGKYVFENIDSTVQNLKNGDILTFSIENDVYIIKVKSIDINNSTAVIYEEKDTSYDELFEYIDIDISSSETDEQVEYIPDENLEITGYEKYDEGENYGLDEITTQSIIDIDKTASMTVNVPVLSTKKENGYLVGDKDSAFSIRGSFDTKVSADFTIKCYYDVDWQWKWKFWDQDDYLYFKIQLDIKVKGAFSLTIKGQGDIPIANISYCLYGIFIEGQMKLHFEATLTFSISVEIKETFGFLYDDDNGFSNLCTTPQVNLIPKGSINVNFSVAIVLEPDVSLAHVITATLPLEVGVEFNIVIAEIDGKELLNISAVKEIHLCDSGDCFEGKLNLFYKFKFIGEIFGKSFAEKDIKPKVTIQIGQFYIRTNPFSWNFSHSLSSEICPNYAYRCDITVVNSNEEPIQNLQVNSNGPDLGDRYKYNLTNATDENGTVSFFYSKGTYTPEFYLNGQKLNVSKTINMIDTTKSVTVKIDTTETEGGGSGHNGGTGSTDWLMYTATFISDGSIVKELEIRSGDTITPPTSPTKDGYYFDCWYYIDDNGKEIDMPDTMPGNDMTFYARWTTTPPNSSDGTGSDDYVPSNVTTGTIIRFGSYPQSKVADTTLISKLDSVSKSWQSYEYYSGDGDWDDGNMTSSDYMQYADFIYDGTKYRAVKFSEYRPYNTGYTSSSSYTYQDDNGYYTGDTYYFKYEPIEWKVLDPSEGLVMCATAIDSQAYNNYVWYGVGSKSTSSRYYGDAAHTYYASDYANSSIREWLNEDFYNTAFSSEQQGKIQLTKSLDNSSTYSTEYDSATTNDKIYLLSYEDTINSNYGFNSDYSAYDTARQLKSSDYAKCQGCYSSTSSSYLGNCWWWLRSPRDSSGAHGVISGGFGYYYRYVDFTFFGVVPALKLNLTSLSTQSVVSTQAEAGEEAEAYSFSYSDCEAVGEYILLNVTNYGSNFTLTTQNLEYIDQITADEDGKVSGSFIPRKAYINSTTLLIGDFGNGIEARILNTTQQQEEPNEPEDVIPDIEIKNYKSNLSVDYKSTLTFHTNIDAPDGYKIVWSNGQEGSTCTLSNVTEKEYKVSARLVRISDNTTVKETQVETVTVNTSFFAKIIAFFKGLFKSLPVYIDNKKQ